MSDWDKFITGKYWWIFFLITVFGILFFGYIVGLIIFSLGVLVVLYDLIQKQFQGKRPKNMSIEELQEHYFPDKDTRE
jgi:hypothetical protein